MPEIHPTASIDPGAQLGREVTVGPCAVIESDVVIGDGCRIGAHAVIKRYTSLGQRNQVHEHAVLGGTPQDLDFPGFASHVAIGNDNILREGVTVHRSKYEGALTRIGDSNYLMAYSHVAHDCAIGDHVVMANNSIVAGHVHVGDRAFISGNTAVHQFCRIGTLAMIGGLSKVTQDCLPFMITDGSPARIRSLNRVGLKRAGISPTDIQALKQAYRLLLQRGLRLEEAIEQMAGLQSAPVDQLIDFIKDSKRGFAHAHRARSLSE